MSLFTRIIDRLQRDRFAASPDHSAETAAYVRGWNASNHHAATIVQAEHLRDANEELEKRLAETVEHLASRGIAIPQREGGGEG